MVGVPTGSKWISTCQQHGTGRATHRCDIEIAKFHSRVTESVDIRRLVLLTSIASQPVLAHVVEQNENDVGTLDTALLFVGPRL